MTVYNWDAIYLGTAADIDTDESNLTAENAASLLGTYGTTGDPLKDHIVTMSVDDVDDDTDINTDNDDFASSDPVTIDGVPHTLDSGVVYNATITYMDGSTDTITAVIMQTTDGDLYLAPEMSNNTDAAAMEAKPIKSLTLDSVRVNPTTVAANRYQTSFMCLAGGTLIAAETGSRRIETLAPGDLILTRDHGLQPLRWLGMRRVSLCRQLSDPAAPPVRIRSGALGPGRPDRDLLLSQQHRVLIRSVIARRMFGSSEVLVAAKKLTGFPGIGLAPATRSLQYFHLAFDQHEIIFAGGLPVESLLLGSQARLAAECGPLVQTGRLPLDQGAVALRAKPARPIAAGRQLRGFLARHLKNRKPLTSSGFD